MSKTNTDDPPPATIVCRADHNVSRKTMDEDALKVLYRLMRSGYTAYLVGGGVRDLLLGRTPKDFDIATDAHPRQIRRLFRNAFLIGRRFRLVHIRFGDKVIETSTFRRRPDASEVEKDDGRAAEDNTFGTPQEDAWRRDFTVNALFYDIRDYSIIDHVGGLDDLEARVIRSIGDPDERFVEDPVRMLRAVRFAARLGFAIEDETYAAMVRHREKVALAAPPRLLEEIYRLFPYGAGEAAFRLLRELHILPVVFPQLDEFLNREGPEVSLFWKHLAGLDRREAREGVPADPSLLFATLFYAPFLEALRRDGAEEQVARHAAVIRGFIEPVAERYRMPKRVFYQTIQTVDGQRRFLTSGKRFSRNRFASHEAFENMLALRRIHLEALGGDTDELREWELLRGKASARRPGDGEEQAAPEGAAGRGRRRRRGGRGGRRHHRAEADLPRDTVEVSAKA